MHPTVGSIRKFLGNRTVTAIRNTTASTMLARVFVLLMTIVIARHLGPESFGVFSFAVGLAVLAGQLGTLGLPTLATLKIPQYIDTADWPRLRGLNRASDLIVILSMIVLAAGFAGSAILFLEPENPLFLGLLLTAVMTVPTGMRLLNRQRCAAIGRPAIGIFLDETMAPLFVLVGCLLLAMTTEKSIFGQYMAGTYFSAALAWWLYYRWQPEGSKAAANGRTVEVRSWIAASLPMVLGIASRVVLYKIDAVMLAPLGSAYDAGLYNTAFRIAIITTMLPNMMNPVIRPRLASANAAGRHGETARTMRLYLRAVTLISGATSLFLLIFANQIVVLAFGQEFAGAASVLQILAVGAFFGTLAEAFSSYLLMCGREKMFGAVSFGVLLIAIATNFVLIPEMGADGAAVTNVLVNVIFLIFTGSIALSHMRKSSRQRIAEGADTKDTAAHD